MIKRASQHVFLLSTAILAGVSLTSINLSPIHAATVSVTANTVQTDTLTTAKQDATSAQSAVDVITNNSVIASQMAASAASTLTEAASVQAVSKDNLDQAKASESSALSMADMATPSAISSANAALSSQTAINQSLSSQVSTDQIIVSDYKNNVATAQSEVAGAQERSNEVKQSVAEAQTNVDQAQSALKNDDGTSAATNLLAAQQKLTSAQSAASSAKATVDEATGAVSAATDDVNLAENSVKSTNQSVDEANNVASAANEALSEAQEQLSAAQGQNGSDGSIKINSDYIDALSALYNANLHRGAIDDDEYESLLKNVSSAAQKLASSFVSNFVPSPVDETVHIDNETDLTKDVLITLSTYAAALINSIRSQAGILGVVVSQGSVKYAQDVARAYEADNWDWLTSGHDFDALIRTAQASGINGYGEDMGAGFTVGSKWNLTLADFKSAIYNNVVGMLFSDAISNWGHSLSVLGIGQSSLAVKEGFSQSFGTSFSQWIGHYSDGDSFTDLALHFEILPNQSIPLDNPNFDTTQIPIPPLKESSVDLTALTNTVNEKQTLVDSATAKLAEAKTAASAAEAALNSAQQQLQKAKLDQNKAITILNTANEVVTQVSGEVETAQDAVNDLSTNVTDKLAVLTSAKNALTLAQSEQQNAAKALSSKQTLLDQMQSKLTTAETKLDHDQQALQDAMRMLGNDQEQLTALTDASTNLANVKKDVIKAQVAYDQATASLMTAQKAANTTDVAQQQLQIQLESARQVLAAAQAKLEKLQQRATMNQQLDIMTTDDHDNKPEPDKQTTLAMNSLSQTSSTTDLSRVETPSKGYSKAISMISPAKKQIENLNSRQLLNPDVKRGLPHTNVSNKESKSILAVFVAEMMSLFGLLIVDRKRSTMSKHARY
ncbi:SEC10/PgrA surface exclusion domain-containing protein [Furfurilactobacillus curtus]|uniref:SEC10/PgrA surface exclusion domain-containing protein n=1 Tax=Furfurilactobacillus curtus TaxID=1746200 RepID=A0ABQ5JNX5_9LACO